MHPQNFPAKLFTGLKIQSRLLGSYRAGAGELYLLIFLNGATVAALITLAMLTLGGGL